MLFRSKQGQAAAQYKGAMNKMHAAKIRELLAKKDALKQGVGEAFIAPGLSAANAAAEDRSYILATASTGGTYYPVGVALATLSKVKLAPKHHFSLSAISSAGSGENVKLLNENEAQFAILQGLYGAWAWSGEGPYEKSGRQEQLRSVSMLWQNVEHLDRKSTRLNSSHTDISRMPSSA